MILKPASYAEDIVLIALLFGIIIAGRGVVIFAQTIGWLS